MKIAQIAPPWLAIPPRLYGGIERVVDNLTRELIKKRHQVLLFAPGDSKTKAKLVPLVPKHLGQAGDKEYKGWIAENYAELALYWAEIERVDIIHGHMLFIPKYFTHTKRVETLHGPASKRILVKCRRLSSEGVFFVAISKKQKELYIKKEKELFKSNKIKWAGVVHNAINVEKYPFDDSKKDYLLFLGRANEEKGIDYAVRVALATGEKLKMAVKVTEEFEKEYWQKKIKPLIAKAKKGQIKVFGEVSRKDKIALLRDAKATLFTSRWEEPFGLVITESLACGTPVIAFRKGAAPEIIEEGETGFIADAERDMIGAIKKLKQIRFKECRKRVQENFSSGKMANGYIKIYREIIKN